MKKIIVSLVLFTFILTGSQSIFGQILDSPRDGVYDEIHTKAREPKPYTHVREADVVWKKRVWRVVDLRQKMNHPFYYPTEPKNNWRNFITVIYEAIQEGTITAYDPTTDDQFLVPFTISQIDDRLNPWQLQPIYDPDNPDNILRYDSIQDEFDPADVDRFLIKEDWFFDKQRSVMDVRILGICPYVKRYNDDGSFRSREKMFWIYYPECRQTFANAEVFNPHNAGEKRTFEDIFWKRKFGSYIIKASNVYDREISDYAGGMDALLEADRIKNEIFTFEHQLWEF